MKRFLEIVCLLMAVVMVGCSSGSSSSSTLSSVAQLTAFSLKSDTTYPGFAAATFKVEERLDTGLVYNVDSILYGTPLTKVVPKFTFAATPGAAYIHTPDTTFALSGSDSVNLEKKPVYISVVSSDGTTTKVYEVRAVVHQVDPDLYHWAQLTSSVYPIDYSDQRVVSLNNRFVMLVNNGFSLHVYSSADGASWTDNGEPAGIPTNCRVRSIISDEKKLYYAEPTMLYTSADGVTWTSTDFSSKSYQLMSMLMVWNDTVWASTSESGQVHLARLINDEFVPITPTPQTDFPVSEFATICFENASGRARAMILGGYSATGASLNTRWNLEFSKTIADGGYRLRDFSIDRPDFKSLTGISVVWYNHQLLMFGGVDADMQYLGRDILISKDEGLTWTAADTAKNQLPTSYTARQKQSVIVRDNRIYVFGGQADNKTFSDVYCGKLNSIDW